MPKFVQMALSPRILRPLFWILLVVALIMALLPKPPETPIDRFGDKFQHMLAFATLAGLARLAWLRARVLWQFGGLALFGALIEILQTVPVLHRTGDLRDWIADCLAAGAALLFAGWVSRYLPVERQV